MKNKEYAALITKELAEVLIQIDDLQSEEFIQALLDTPNIFIAGAGRSGYMARGFCMRLMHMGLNSYMVGDTTTPNIKENDVLVICSGSGETKSLLMMSEKAKDLKAKIILITINPASSIGKNADLIVRINAPSPKAIKEGDIKSIQPMGNLFEQSLLIFLDISIMILMDKKGLSSKEMFARHANLE